MQMKNVFFLYILAYFVIVIVLILCYGWQLQFWLHFPATFCSISGHNTAFRAYFVSTGKFVFLFFNLHDN